ncbi:MAG: formylmethanofuran dehydrogenase subunit C [Parvibaculaceae bacterium]
MKPMVFERKALPDQRIDLSALVPARLAGMTLKAVEALPIHTTRNPLAVGDVFRVRAGNPSSIRIRGATDRFDNVGAELDGGEIHVTGDVGELAGRLMRGGTLVISGNAGPWAGSGLKGGRIEIGGGAGDWLGGPLPGEMAGMRGGLLRVKRNAGKMAGDRLRRGTIVVGGTAGPYAGSRMIAGTLIIAGAAGPWPGFLMRRGSLFLKREPEAVSPTFLDCGPGADVFRSLLARELGKAGLDVGWIARPGLSRFGGDTAVLGRGEIFMPA